MGISLKKHNEEAYGKVKEMLKEGNKAAVVHPTGTGKTYIALKWIEESQGKTIYLAPSNHILNQVQETIEKARENGEISEEQYKRYKEVKYTTYTSLMELSKMEGGYDNIILDEFHRCGAPEWGKGVDRIIQASQSAKIIGMSATPLRAVDNKDMADELFEGNIASEMTLEEAVAEGIIEAPIYVNGIYSLNEVILQAESKIEKIRDEETKKELRKDIEKAKRHLEEAEGLDDIFAKYANKKEGKYIVFCSDIDDMHKKMQEASKWFEKVGETRLYEVSYKKSEELNEDTLTRFREEKGKINLLFSVDKLNEGIHVDGIDGVIMLRKTGSPIVYMQQLGRALSAGNEGTPLVFDLVNNIDSSRYVYEFMERVQQIRKEKGIEDERIGRFKVYEQQRKIKDVLKNINEKLKRSTYLQKAYAIKEWMKKNETTRPPRIDGKDILDEEKRLGQALYYIRYYLIKPYKELKTEEEREVYRKRHPEIDEVKKIIEEIDKNNIPVKLQQAREIKEWMEKNSTTTPPRISGSNIPDEEKRLGQALGDIMKLLIKPYERLKTEKERKEYIDELENRKINPMTREQFMEVREILKEIIEKRVKKIDIPTILIEAREIKEWMKRNKTTRPPSKNSKDEEEKKLGEKLSKQIRQRLINPYEKLITEQEKEEYIDKLENRRNNPITREQFMEIIGIVEEIDRNNIPTKLMQARDIKEWMEKNKTTRPPSKKSKDEEEKRLGQALQAIRSYLLNPYEELKTDNEREKYIDKLENKTKDSMTREEFMEIKEIIENILEKTSEKLEKSTYLQKAYATKEWMERNKTTRPPSKNSKDEEEKRLGQALSVIRHTLIKPYEELKTEEEKEEYRKRHPEIDEVKKIVEEIDRNNIPTKLKQAIEIKEWMEKNKTTRPPRISGNDATDEELRLGQALNNIRDKIKIYTKLTEEEREEYRKKHPEIYEIKKIIEEIDRNNIPVKLKRAREIKEWMKKNKTTRRPSATSKDEEEKRLGQALNAIRSYLLNPYEESKTDNEREDYIKGLENRRNNPMTRKEFMEVKKIVEEIDRKRENLAEIVEQAKATKEKVAEAKQLESMYEQELESKKQKEGSDKGDDSN